MAKRKQLPLDWEQIARRRVAYWNRLSGDEQVRLGEIAEHLVADKRWEAAKGFDLTDEIIVTIAVQAGVLLLELDADYFAKVTSIIVHPTTFSIPGPRATAIHGMVDEGFRPLHGEAHHDRGPVLLAWDEARYAARHRGRGHNVVLHEFAHKIDMLDGIVDGTPMLPDRAARDRWIAVCESEMALLRRGENDGVLDDYAATDPGEFFAVATEVFFDRPLALRELKPALYEVLMDFYRQDPAGREPQPST